MDFGAAKAGIAALNTPIALANKGSNITLAASVENPKVVFNPTEMTLTVSGASGTPAEVSYYLIGSNVNGKTWALKADDAKFTSLGDGQYEWTGTTLGSQFKINDGTWGAINLGGSSSKLALDTPYTLSNSSTSPNIVFADGDLLNNPKVIFDSNTNTITVSGSFKVDNDWYLTGAFCNWADPGTKADLLFKEVDPNVYSVSFTADAPTDPLTKSELSISKFGWSARLGLAEGNATTLSDTVTTCQLVEGGANIPYSYGVGNTYQATLHLDTLTLEVQLIQSANPTGVSTLQADSQATYFTLQGTRVDSPAKGLYIRVAGGKASKVILN